MQDRWLHLFFWRDVPIKLHWTVLALALIGILSGRYSAFGLLGIVVIILAHELGHAVLAKRFRLRVLQILIHPFGGECIHEATQNDRQRVIIAWGGVAAQAALFCIAVVVAEAIDLRPFPALRDFLMTLIGHNFVMAVFNLLPMRPLDGSTAWKLGHLRRRAMRESPRARLRPVSAAQRRDIERLVDGALEHARSQAEAADESSE
jgi:Zn-dependent protease